MKLKIRKIKGGELTVLLEVYPCSPSEKEELSKRRIDLSKKQLFFFLSLSLFSFSLKQHAAKCKIASLRITISVLSMSKVDDQQQFHLMSTLKFSSFIRPLIVLWKMLEICIFQSPNMRMINLIYEIAELKEGSVSSFL